MKRSDYDPVNEIKKIQNELIFEISKNMFVNDKQEVMKLSDASSEEIIKKQLVSSMLFSASFLMNSHMTIKQSQNKISSDIDLFSEAITKKIASACAIIEDFLMAHAAEIALSPERQDALQEEWNAFRLRIPLEALEGSKTIRQQFALSEHLFEMFYELGAYLFNRASFSEAEDLFFFLVRLDPLEPAFLIGCGNAAYYNENYELSSNCYYSALCLGADDYNLFFYLISSETKRGNQIKAQEIIELLLQHIEKLPSDILNKYNEFLHYNGRF